ncbi:MAG: FkbM family methyltransferase [Candidatus Pacebacteria bacterium]|nr:FkbM family methyltransferase [Candidatus Paceibacterota bacterium]
MSILFNALISISSLFKAPLSMRRKLLILWWYLCILVALPFAPLTRQRRMYCAGFVIEGFDLSTLRFLYEETFLRQEYNVQLKVTPYCVDAGANIGIATLFIKWLYPEAHVLAIEPDPATVELLRKNVVRNKLTNVTVFHGAIGDHSGELNLYVHPTKKGSLKMSTYARKGMTVEVQVPAERLSTLLLKAGWTQVDLAKIDIEGAEWQVLHDLTTSGWLTKVQQYVIEYHHLMGTHESKFGEFLKHFETAGYLYQMNTKSLPYNHAPQFQDVLLYLKQIT